MYALKKVLIQSEEQLELVRQEIQVSSLFKHPNLIRLLESSIISVKVRQRYPTSLFAWRELRSKFCSGLGYSSLLTAWKIKRLCSWVQNDGSWSQEAYLVFPVYRDGTVLDYLNRLQSENKFFPTITVLHIFQQVRVFSIHDFPASFPFSPRTEFEYVLRL